MTFELPKIVMTAEAEVIKAADINKTEEVEAQE